jgi:hypothetical protein
MISRALISMMSVVMIVLFEFSDVPEGKKSPL